MSIERHDTEPRVIDARLVESNRRALDDALAAEPITREPVVVNVVQHAAPSTRPQPNHVLHGVLSLLTGGLWLPVWLVIARRAKRRG